METRKRKEIFSSFKTQTECGGDITCSKGTTKLPLQVDLPSNWVKEWQREPLGGAISFSRALLLPREGATPQAPRPGEECHLPQLSIATVVQKTRSLCKPLPRKCCSQDSNSLFYSWKQSLISEQRLRTVGRAAGHSNLTTRSPKTISTIRAAAPGLLLLSTLLPGRSWHLSHFQDFWFVKVFQLSQTDKVGLEFLGEWLWFPVLISALANHFEISSALGPCSGVGGEGRKDTYRENVTFSCIANGLQS